MHLFAECRQDRRLLPIGLFQEAAGGRRQRQLTRLLTGITAGLALLFAAWGSLLLLRDDPDGGAHAGGWFMLGWAIVLALPAAIFFSLQSSDHRSADNAWLRGFLAVAAVLGVGVLLLSLFGTP